MASVVLLRPLNGELRMPVQASVSCGECGKTSALDGAAVVATAQVAAFAAAHQGHDRMTIELVLVAPASEASATRRQPVAHLAVPLSDDEHERAE